MSRIIKRHLRGLKLNKIKKSTRKAKITGKFSQKANVIKNGKYTLEKNIWKESDHFMIRRCEIKSSLPNLMID